MQIILEFRLKTQRKARKFCCTDATLLWYVPQLQPAALSVMQYQQVHDGHKCKIHTEKLHSLYWK